MDDYTQTVKEVVEYKISKIGIEKILLEHLRIDMEKIKTCNCEWKITNGGINGIFISTEKIIDT